MIFFNHIIQPQQKHLQHCDSCGTLWSDSTAVRYDHINQQGRPGHTEYHWLDCQEVPKGFHACRGTICLKTAKYFDRWSAARKVVKISMHLHQYSELLYIYM